MLFLAWFIVYMFSYGWDVAGQDDDLIRGDSVPADEATENQPYRCNSTLRKFDDYHVNIDNWVPYEHQRRDPASIPQRLQYQHLSHAGIGEFPYLLDVRTKYKSEAYSTDTELWFNANLITSAFALTTCDAISTYTVAQETNDPSAFSFLDASGTMYRNYFLQLKDPKQYMVWYASSYRYIVRRGPGEMGQREIDHFIQHPHCRYYHVDFSFGLLQLSDPIYPYPPYTTYMHVDFICGGFQDLKRKYNSQPTGELRVLDKMMFPDAACTIGLWGRYNREDYSVVPINELTAVLNYKLRYRVRFVDPQECKNVIDMFPARYHALPVKYIECMALSQNETIGAICNHDQGAPIVCGEGPDEAVRAILIAGVRRNYCNNTTPNVFMVVDIRMAFPLFAHVSVHALQNITSGRLIRYSGGPSIHSQFAELGFRSFSRLLLYWLVVSGKLN